MSTSSPADKALSQELSLIGGLGAALLLVFHGFFLQFWPMQQVLTLAVQGSLIWLICLYRCYLLLALNRASMNSAPYAKLGWANRLSLARAWLIAFTASFIFQPNISQNIVIFPALAYFLAAIIDRVDGYVARISRQQSLLGEKLDTETDALGLLVAPLLAIWLGQIHWSYLAVSLAYYLYQAGLYWRRRQNLQIHPLPKNPERRAIAGFQMGFLAVVLWPVLTPPATTIAGFAFMLPLLAGFIVDWLTSAGTIQREDPGTERRLNKLYHLIQYPLLPLLRLGLAVLLVFSCYQKQVFITGFFQQPAMVLVILACVGMIVLGYAGRLSALILTCLFAYFLRDYQVNVIDALVLMFSIWLMQLGTGKYSAGLWDDKWVKRYDGAS